MKKSRTSLYTLQCSFSDLLWMGLAAMQLASRWYTTYMYLCSWLDITGYLPVRSVARRSFSVRMVVTRVLERGPGGSKLVGYSLDLRFWCTSFMWPWSVSIGLDRWREMRSAMRPVQVEKKPWLMALMRVARGKDNRALW